MKPRVLVTRHLPGPALAQLAQATDMSCWRGPGPLPHARLLEEVQACEGLLCLLTDHIGQDVLAAAPKLRVISSCSVGVDHVDLSALARRRIPLGHTPGVLVEATADLAFALLLAVARRLPEADRFVRDGAWTPERRWEPEMLLGKDVHGSTLGIVGLGAIGQAVARRAQGFGMRVLGWTPSGRRVTGVEPASLEELLAAADFVSLHLALNGHTRQIIDARALARMRRGAVLVNTARGALVDEGALLDALRSGHLGGAALDVFEREPVAADHLLLGLLNVVVAPHIGSATLGVRSRMAQLAVDNLLAGLRGEALPHQANRGDVP